MSSQTRIVLNSFQGGRAILDLHYADRHARWKLEGDKILAEFLQFIDFYFYSRHEISSFITL